MSALHLVESSVFNPHPKEPRQTLQYEIYKVAWCVFGFLYGVESAL
ncbi:unnamed protein product [Acanthoscelides obtectus]|uniref:Uncharacterized protein n=1 Tax=Acanthoscelides obtectus TaxID=200917 RepID=A0A9P0KMF2_ACAOB|nr:unnamed protein product [Acanthoscelides obtectus]CAK1685450.1 hypothetical protein AOBTE_LOCUS35413 [Acanthoscelides obtectus]